MHASSPMTASPPRSIKRSGKTRSMLFWSACRHGEIAEGFIIAVDKCGKVLAEHFPPEPGGEDQLPDRIYLI